MHLDPWTPGSDPQPLDAAVGEVELIVSGDLDLATRDELLVRLLTLALTSRRRVVIDLADVEFLDAAGARALRRGRSLAADLGVEVMLRSPQDQVRTVLDLTGLTELVAVE